MCDVEEARRLTEKASGVCSTRVGWLLGRPFGEWGVFLLRPEGIRIHREWEACTAHRQVTQLLEGGRDPFWPNFLFRPCDSLRRRTLKDNRPQPLLDSQLSSTFN